MNKTNDVNNINFTPDLWEKIQGKTKKGDEISRPSLTYWQDAWRRLKLNKASMGGLFTIILLIIIAVFGPLVSPYTYYDQDLNLASIPHRFEIYQVDENNHVYLHKALRMYTVTAKGEVLEKLTPVENNVMKKYQVYEVNGKKITVDYSSKPIQLKSEDGNIIQPLKKVWNKRFWFGTDELGRDLLIRVIYGARISLLIGFIAAIVNFTIGVLYGGTSGYLGGRADNIMMRIVDIINTIPLVLYVILIMVVIGSGLRSIIITLGTIYWVNMARIVRGQILSLKEQEFVLAAKTLGADTWRILVRHLIPNAMGPIIVTMTMMIPTAIFTESFLSFIGLGVSAPMASWGTLCNDALGGLRSYPYLLFFPSLAICITMLAFNFLGDGLRDALDPRLRK
ncbi:ABC transporter permease [Paramaledivibacter caminithermalis]|jgi:oligopeptide transport system permease protein|uniref:Oligopeptide transport system permease protein n=1 Tax=Paramaledivibacter caminithermalis (strain DSM 15212 / CIP 107654 / DViRD3) TaxID=1121301 RepID=A0A1M6NTV3_PARC5|nr:ABC transporter permease [Paramaledivibacter caminithermalis]SHJ99156.1 oligopeptide transport system permease protein [Paramaledivibacter caminithermalis DSM 15212]